MSATTLPQNLLHDIFSLVVSSSKPYLWNKEDWEEYTIHKDLRSFSLVHSTWRRPAQALLPSHLNIPESTSKWEWMAKQLHKPPFKTAKTESLVIEGLWGRVLKKSFEKRWENVTYLWIDTPRPNLHGLRFFPNLETLWVCASKLVLDNPKTRLPRLKRLVLSHHTQIIGKLEMIQQILSPTTMPRLQHLALQAYHHEFSMRTCFLNLLPQIHTLALEDRYDSKYSSLFKNFSVMDNLEHLALTIESTRYTYQDFWLKVAGLKLKTLHVNYGAIMFDETYSEDHSTSHQFSEGLVRVAKGEMEDVSIERIVVYGMKWFGGEEAKKKGWDLLDWRTNSQVPPFEEFDGGYHRGSAESETWSYSSNDES